jgi:hypothetical protein
MTFSEISSGDEYTNVGRIYGYTYQIIGWETLPAPFVLVQAGSEQDISNIFGYYELNDLPLGQVYEVTANKFGYEEATVTVELSYEEPEVEVNFLLTLKDISQYSLYEQTMDNTR